MADNRRDRGRELTVAALIVLTVLWMVALIPAVYLAVISPESQQTLPPALAWRVVIGLHGFPIVLILSTLAAWVLFGRRRHAAAIMVVLAPAVYALVFVFLVLATVQLPAPPARIPGP